MQDRTQKMRNNGGTLGEYAPLCDVGELGGASVDGLDEQRAVLGALLHATFLGAQHLSLQHLMYAWIGLDAYNREITRESWSMPFLRPPRVSYD